MTKTVRRTAALWLLAGILSACAGERPQDLGSRNGVLAPCKSSPNCVSTQAVDKQHQISPLRFTGDPGAAFARLKQTLTRRSDTSVVTENADYLRVEFRTTFFVDDGEFLLDRPGGRIQFRSASRIGYSDLGKNRSRMEAIRRDFQTEEGKAP